MDAEIVADDPEPIIEKLIASGFELDVIDWLDRGCSSIKAAMFTELDEHAFCRHVEAIVDPLGGIVMEGGFVSRPSPIQSPGLIKRRSLRVG
jgi:hypothetical protein